MNILVSPNSMKGSLSAFEFADIVEKAFLEVSSDFRIRKIPVADGGDLTGQVLSRALNAKEINIEAEDPLGRSVLSKYAVAGECAIIEMADASGLKLLNVEELNPMKASTYGTGQLIADAIKTGCTEILLGVGGSATVDGGTGMMEALGFKFFDNDNKPLKGNGGNLEKISYIEKPHIKNISVKIICDVDNTLTGRNGAAVIFGPQKGASPDMITSLEKGLTAWGNLLKMHCGKDLLSLKGAGAAGGISLPLIAFYDAEIVPGADYVLSLLGFEDHVRWSDLVITGEGKIDAQTLHNKAPKAVADMAHRFNKPVIAFGGNVQREASKEFSGIFSILNEPMPVGEALRKAPGLLYNFSYEMAQLLIALSRLSKKTGN